MFSKFKKVLVSLALASSLALAPMNVSAAYNGPIKGSASADPAVNANEEAVKVPVYLIGTASAPEYVIEVSPSITINLDDNSTSASDLAAEPQDAKGGIYLKLTTAVDFEEKNLQVTPSFAVSEGDPTITLDANNGKSDSTKKLSELGIDSDLLRFGTYTEDTLTEGTNSVAFAENENNTVKSVSTDVNATKSAAIRQAMPNEIEGEGNVHIADNQQIGNVTFACEFVAPEAAGN